MRIPLPCKMGNFAECNGKLLPLCKVSWFHWTWGMEYTYFFARNDFWHGIDFYTTFDLQQPYEFIIPDSLLVDKLIKEHGYPLKGRGYAVGIKCRNEKIYMDFLMTSMYFAHIAVQCDDSGKYVSGGDIIFPLSWDTEEKRNSAVLKGFRFHRDKPCKQCKLSDGKENVDIGQRICRKQ